MATKHLPHVKGTTAVNVQEGERLGPLNNQIVNIHRHQVYTNGDVLLYRMGNHQLCTDSICCENKDWRLSMGS